jgi:hypothetical protein
VCLRASQEPFPKPHTHQKTAYRCMQCVQCAHICIGSSRRRHHCTHRAQQAKVIRRKKPKKHGPNTHTAPKKDRYSVPRAQKRTDGRACVHAAQQRKTKRIPHIESHSTNPRAQGASQYEKTTHSHNQEYEQSIAQVARKKENQRANQKREREQVGKQNDSTTTIDQRIYIYIYIYIHSHTFTQRHNAI